MLAVFGIVTGELKPLVTSGAHTADLLKSMESALRAFMPRSFCVLMSPVSIDIALSTEQRLELKGQEVLTDRNFSGC